MSKIIDGAQRAAALDIPKRTRYKEEAKKPWIYAHYALLAGGQKRQARLQKEAFEAKKAAAEALIKEQENAANQANPAN